MNEAITPLLITYNEAPNIGRTLDKLTWAKRIVVVDSGSTDETLAILKAHPQVEIVAHAFVDFASQCNFGLTFVTTEWVLSLDADYELSDALVAELQSLKPSSAIAGYQARFVYRIYGRPLRGTLYPPRTVLYRKTGAVYSRIGHGHRVAVSGPVAALAGAIYHDDRKPLSHWIASQLRYAHDEAAHLLACRRAELSHADKLRLVAWPAPLIVVFYVLFAKRCILDGWPGWFYALQRCLAELLLALELIDLRLRGQPPGSPKTL
jgi:glycosyltransferase involved in cell wall biosynthesis